MKSINMRLTYYQIGNKGRIFQNYSTIYPLIIGLISSFSSCADLKKNNNKTEDEISKKKVVSYKKSL